uniref:Putative ixodes 8-cys protein n=1 Tax=Ixodes ricinus TaxID=34613 RepID=A0A0K8RCN6_IXORI
MFKLKFCILCVLAVLRFGSGNGGGESKSPGEEKEGRSLGSDLPTYIGTLEARKEYMMKLLEACGGQSQEHKLNEREIFFHNCTYTCVRRGQNPTPEVRRIPTGMICNRDKKDMPKSRKLPLAKCAENRAPE